MKYDQQKIPDQIDIQDWMKSLMEEIGFKGAEPKKWDRMWDVLGQQVKTRVMNAVTQNLDTDALAEVMARNSEKTDFNAFVDDLIEETPEIQIAILDELDDLRDKLIKTSGIK